MEDLCDDLETCFIEERDNYYVNPSLDISDNDLFKFADVNLNVYKMFTIFGEPPIQLKKCMYAYKIEGPHSCFLLSSIGESLTNATKWSIQSSTNDTISNDMFLVHLNAAVKCYNTYYKGIEKHNFTSPHKIVEMRLMEIHQELLDNKKLISSI